MSSNMYHAMDTSRVRSRSRSPHITTDREGNPCEGNWEQSEPPICAECNAQMFCNNKHNWVKFAATQQDWTLMTGHLRKIPIWVPMRKAWQGSHSWMTCICHKCQCRWHQEMKDSLLESTLEPAEYGAGEAATCRVILHALANQLWTNITVLEQLEPTVP